MQPVTKRLKYSQYYTHHTKIKGAQIKLFKISLKENGNMFKRNNKYFKPQLRLRLKPEAEFENELFYEINN